MTVFLIFKFIIGNDLLNYESEVFLSSHPVLDTETE